jgi:hypothetical protein
MKRTVFLCFMILAGLSVFAQSAVIKEFSGTVEVKYSGSASFVPAKAWEQVKEDTIISTGFKSAATIEAGRAARVRL